MSLIALYKVAICLGFASTTALLILTIVRPALGLKFVVASALVVLALMGFALLATGLEALAWRMGDRIHSTEDDSSGRSWRLRLARLLAPFHLGGFWEPGQFLRRLLRFLFLPAGTAAVGVAGVLFLVEGDSVLLVNTGYLSIYLVIILLLSFLARLLYPVAGIDYL